MRSVRCSQSNFFLSLLVLVKKSQCSHARKCSQRPFVTPTKRREKMVMYLPSRQNIAMSWKQIALVDDLPIPDAGLNSFRKATACDANLQILMSTVLEGWPSTENRVPQEIKSYFCCREDITVQNGLLFKGESIIVPSQLRKEMMGRRRFTRPTWVWKDVSAVQGSVLAIGPGWMLNW